VPMPCRAGAGFENDVGGGGAGRVFPLEQGIDSHRTSEVLGRPCRDGCEPLRVIVIICDSLVEAAEGAYDADPTLAWFTPTHAEISRESDMTVAVSRRIFHPFDSNAAAERFADNREFVDPRPPGRSGEIL
jgi:hypothetical protein